MTLRLKSLELQGYKTFASRTVFEFDGPVTAIVGPNGSGKSNIADSVRWVLGEQSFSLLRGKKTEDMIFSGSELRPRAGMASAMIVFDNSDGWLPIDFSEVAITRRAYRDGENEYLLNGQKVRLRDVSELLSQSGLAERTYTVIGQGLVDAALALKAEERRRLFEEAAGIGLYRSRREEALKRLETTQRNLDRVKDILAELQPRVRSLERQARRALEYEQVKNDLRLMLRDWYGYHWHRLQKEYTEAHEAARVQENSLEQVSQEQGSFIHVLNISRERIQGLRSQLGVWHRDLAKLHTQREEISRFMAVSDERVRALNDQSQETKTELARLEEELVLHQERLDQAGLEVARLQGEMDEARSQAGLALQAFHAIQAEHTSAEKRVSEARQMLSSLTAQQSHLQARLAERESRLQSQDEALQSALQSLAINENELENTRAEHQVLEMVLKEAQENHQSAQAVLQDHSGRITSLENSLKKLLERRSGVEAGHARLQAQLDVLEQAESSLVGYASGAKVLIEAARLSRLKGAHGILGTALDVKAEYEAAIAAALGLFLDGILLDKEADSEEAFRILGEQSSRAVLLPLDSLSSLPSPGIPRYEAGFVGVASELVSTGEELLPLVDLLLGNVWIVQDHAAAKRVLRFIRNKATLKAAQIRVVTMLGEVFYPEGPILAGQGMKPVTLSRPRQRRELQSRLDKANDELQELNEQAVIRQKELAVLHEQGLKLAEDLQGVTSSVEEARISRNRQELVLDKLIRQVQWQREQRSRLEFDIQATSTEVEGISSELVGLESKISDARASLRAENNALSQLSLDDHQTQLSHWDTRVAVAELALNQAQSRLIERQEALEQARELYEGLERRYSEIHQALNDVETEKNARRQEEVEITEGINALHTLIDPSELELEAAEREQADLLKNEGSLRQRVSLAEHRHAQAKITLARRHEAVEGLRHRIEDDFGLVEFEYAEDVSGPTPLPLNGMVEQLPVVSELSLEIDELINRQRAQLRRMGAINPEAQAEYQEVKERFEFLNTQVGDLEKAEGDIKQVITELDLLMERDFRVTFDAVAQEFREIFSRLFGGGSARLVLTDPDDLTVTGIDIEARLPGRREQGLSLLSGGERSLTATSLVFALLKVSPTPFCILDEVDAMLDETNVGRFRDLLRELSQNTQFIVVTHNRNTVQVADVIYGVTMGRNSSSQVLGLRLDEVSEVYEN